MCSLTDNYVFRLFFVSHYSVSISSRGLNASTHLALRCHHRQLCSALHHAGTLNGPLREKTPIPRTGPHTLLSFQHLDNGNVQSGAEFWLDRRGPPVWGIREKHGPEFWHRTFVSTLHTPFSSLGVFMHSFYSRVRLSINIRSSCTSPSTLVTGIYAIISMRRTVVAA